MSAEFVGEDGPEITPPNQTGRIIRPAVPVVPGKPLTCKWCSGRLGELKGIYLCQLCDAAESKLKP